MKYKLLVIDVDGTLLNESSEMTSHTRSAILKAQQMGIQLVLSSGRPSGGILPLAKELELDNYRGFVIAYNGAQIIDMSNGTLLFDKRIDRTLIPYLNKKAKKNGFAIFTYSDNAILTDSPLDTYIQHEADLNNMFLQEVENFPESIDFDPCKCVLASEDETALIGLENHWKRKLAGTVDVFRSEDYFLEVVPATVDKGNALALLMQMLQMEREEVIAIGDGVADVPMLQLAGLSVAMGNARDSVQACADAVTLSNSQEGVAVAIEKMVLATIRPTEVPLDLLNARGKHALMGNLGIQYTYASETRVEATMPVDERTRQPFGILHGGATLALAETVAGLGSMLIVQPDEIVVGMQVSGNHISSAHEGDTVRAIATIIHKGRSSHVWNVDVFTSTDRLVSSVRVMNSVMKKK